MTKKEEATIEVLVHEDESVSVTLRNGDVYTLREPKVRAFMQIESWTNSDDPMVKTKTGLAMKVISVCIKAKNGEPYQIANFEDFCDEVDVRDMEVFGAALANFRSVFEYLEARAAESEEATAA